jgi:acetylornithine deacetylase
MVDATELILTHLGALVACDTRNPPRDQDGIARLFTVVREALKSGVDVEERDLGDGCRWLRARRGGAASRSAPLVNVHIDTVPADPGWQHDPFVLRREARTDVGNVVVGLGACDIKGAVAAFLVAAADTSGPFDLLLTSDEEAGSSRCVKTFIAEHADDVAGRLVLVAEPTMGAAVCAHRGIGTATMTFSGVAGHASQHRAIADSAVAEAVRFCSAALDVAARDDNAIRLNLGRIEGGTKANMIASSCLLRFGVRPPPEHTPESVLTTLTALASASRTTTELGFLAPALPAPCASRTIADARATSRARASALGLSAGADVDFFTEAAFFSGGGADAVVFGPGDIAQAHTPEEWVAVSQLLVVADAYRSILQGGAA